MSLPEGLSILFIFSKKQLVVSLIFAIVFLASIVPESWSCLYLFPLAFTFSRDHLPQLRGSSAAESGSIFYVASEC